MLRNLASKLRLEGEFVNSWHKIVFGDCRIMKEVPDKSVHLVVTSPPYFNAPFDYPGLFKEYDEYLDLISTVAKELRRVLAPGRVACFVTQDVRINGKLYPVAADIVRIMMREGFFYRDRIIWRKPAGYIRISRRSGVIIQHPYPMYFYPDNLFEEILILQNGEYQYPKISLEHKSSQISLSELNEGKWYLSVWDITNVLPFKGRPEEGIAAFPEEIPKRLIKLFTFVGETVLDPFLGSGTTMKVAKRLGRNSYGYEIDLELKDVILKKVGFTQTTLTDATTDKIEVVERKDARRLRSNLQERVKNQRSVAKKSLPKTRAAPPKIAASASQTETKLVQTKSGWEKLKATLTTVDAVDERLRHAKQNNLSPSYVRTLERLKAHLEKQQVASHA
jgi:DNA modification methylase